MTLAQYVSQRDGHDAATDALLFMTMGNAILMQRLRHGMLR